MKKIKLIGLLVLVGVMIMPVLFFAGCGNSEDRCADVVSYGNFYTLQMAYDKGLITFEDLLDIAYFHGGGVILNGEVFNHTPRPKLPEELSTEMNRKIRQSHLARLCGWGELSAGIDNISLDYYGTFNDAVALMVHDDYSDLHSTVTQIVVAEITFIFPNTNTIVIWMQK